MDLFDTEHKRKAAIKTTVIMAILILSFFWVGMKYLDPPDELGVEVNFGTMDMGSGNVETMQDIKTAPKPVQTQPQPNPQPEPEPVEETTPAKDPVMTQDDKDSPVTAPKEKPQPKPQPKPKPKPKPKPDAGTTNALNNILNGPKSDGTAGPGEGDDDKGGNKGQIDGTRYGNSYFGGGTGNGKGYGLNGRRRVHSVKETPECNEQGRVVVKIYVNRRGKVIKAVKNIKGSTTSVSCLVEKAIESAKKTTFSPAPDAPETQIGFIIFDYKLGG